MSHWSDNGNVSGLGQRKNVVVVLKQHNRLSVNLASQSNIRLGMDVLRGLRCWDTEVWVLEKAAGELGLEKARDCLVDDLDVQLSRLDHLGDLGEAVRSTAHLDIVSCGKSLGWLEWNFFSKQSLLT